MSLNAAAVARTVAALNRMGVLHEEHSALVQVVDSLALAVDSDPGNASLWREFRAALDSLMKLGDTDDGNGDELTQILAAFRGGSKVDDAKDAKQVDARSGGRENRGTTRRASDAVATGGRKSRS